MGKGSKGAIGGLFYIAEKVAYLVTKHAKRLLKWLHFVETCTLRAAFSMCFDCRELN